MPVHRPDEGTEARAVRLRRPDSSSPWGCWWRCATTAVRNVEVRAVGDAAGPGEDQPSDGGLTLGMRTATR